jgi:hypothetical protein
MAASIGEVPGQPLRIWRTRRTIQTTEENIIHPDSAVAMGLGLDTHNRRASAAPRDHDSPRTTIQSAGPSPTTKGRCLREMALPTVLAKNGLKPCNANRVPRLTDDNKLRALTLGSLQNRAQPVASKDSDVNRQNTKRFLVRSRVRMHIATLGEIPDPLRAHYAKGKKKRTHSLMDKDAPTQKGRNASMQKCKNASAQKGKNASTTTRQSAHRYPRTLRADETTIDKVEQRPLKTRGIPLRN